MILAAQKPHPAAARPPRVLQKDQVARLKAKVDDFLHDNEYYHRNTHSSVVGTALKGATFCAVTASLGLLSHADGSGVGMTAATVAGAGLAAAMNYSKLHRELPALLAIMGPGVYGMMGGMAVGALAANHAGIPGAFVPLLAAAGGAGIGALYRGFADA